jgi:ketosteroid isomerase-like protein
VDTGSDGTVRNKAEAIAGQKTVRFISADFDDVKLNAYGDTVIVTGAMNAKAVALASGSPFEIHERNTDTWVRMPNGQWQCVATQQTAVLPPLTQREKTADTKTMSSRRK